MIASSANFQELIAKKEAEHQKMLENQSLLGDNPEKLSSPLVNSQSLQINSSGHSANNINSNNIMNNSNNKNTLKYQYSFTDAIILDEMSSTADFKVSSYIFTWDGTLN